MEKEPKCPKCNDTKMVVTSTRPTLASACTECSPKPEAGDYPFELAAVRKTMKADPGKYWTEITLGHACDEIDRLEVELAEAKEKIVRLDSLLSWWR